MGVLGHACQANMSLGKLDKFKGILNLKGYMGIHVGRSTDIMLIVGMVSNNNTHKELKSIIT